jgi:hypothetical protein
VGSALLLLQHKREKSQGSDRRGGGDGGAASGLGFGAPPTCPPSAIINPNCKAKQSKAQATILCWLTVMPRLLHVSSVSSGEHKPSPRVLLLGCVYVCVCVFLGCLVVLRVKREREA